MARVSATLVWAAALLLRSGCDAAPSLPLPAECAAGLFDSPVSTTFSSEQPGLWYQESGYLNDKSDKCQSGPSFCTYADPQMAQFGAPLPGGGTGLAMPLSQAPCAAKGACCGSGECANWAGAHLTTARCLHYGSFSFTATLQGLPAATQGAFYVGLRVTAATTAADAAQNEIDVGLSPTTLLPTQESRHEPHVDGEVMAIPGDGAELVTAYFGPGPQLAAFNAGTEPSFTTAQASNWTTYTVVWTPGSIQWFVGSKLYWSAATAVQPAADAGKGAPNLVPWRPMNLRIIVRTSSGSPAPAPPGVVYLRDLTITPWTGAMPTEAAATPQPASEPAQEQPQEQPQPLMPQEAPMPPPPPSPLPPLPPSPSPPPPPPKSSSSSTSSSSTDWSLFSSTTSSDATGGRAGDSGLVGPASSNPADPWLMAPRPAASDER